MKNTTKQTGRVWSMINHKVFLIGIGVLLLFVTIGIAFPAAFNNGMNAFNAWSMKNFKWVYVLCAVITSVFGFWVMFSKVGDIRLAAKTQSPASKPSLGSPFL